MIDTDHRVNAKSFIGAVCTLNGRPAVISGRKNNFAVVTATDLYDWTEFEGQRAQRKLDPLSAAYAWRVVKQVMLNDQAFTCSDESAL